MLWPDHLESGFFRSADCRWGKTYSLLLSRLRSAYWASWVIIFSNLLAQMKIRLKTISFYIGFVLYASTAFGWVFVMKHLKLATIGVVYSVSMVLLLTAMGVVFFRESLNYYEIAGLIMAIASLILLVRFA